MYTTDPQITTQTYSKQHRNHHYVPVSGDYQYTNNPNNLENNGNDHDYQTTITHTSRDSTPLWTTSASHGSNSNAYHNHQHQQPAIQHTQQYHQQYQHGPVIQHSQQYHQQHQHGPVIQHTEQYHQQQQQQPMYERQRTTHTSHMGHSTEQSAGKLQATANDITDYYTGCPSGHTGQLPYAYDCRRFLNCWKGRGHIQTCSVGTVFNPETLECDRPDKVKCGAGLLTQPHTTSTTTLHGQQPQAGSGGNRGGRYIDATTDSVDILCPPGSQGLEPHPSDCTKFINCANGNVHIQDCGPGTAFSIPMKVCDFKDKVDCSGRGGSTTVTSNAGNTAAVNVRQGNLHLNS